jgi:hypothetical protein
MDKEFQKNKEIAETEEKKGVLYADLVGANQAPHTPQTGC